MAERGGDVHRGGVMNAPMRDHHRQCCGIRSAAQQGSVPLAGAAAGGLHLPAGDQEPVTPARRARHRHSSGYTASSTTPSARATPGSPLQSRTSPSGWCSGFGVPTSSTARAAISRRRWAVCRWCRSTCRRGRRGRSARPPSSASWRRSRRTSRGCAAARRHYILCGDWNIAHQEIDLSNWRANQKNSGFLPEERAWMDKLFGPAGYVGRLPRGATRGPTSTRGGRTAARRAKRTSAGASTTRW